MSKPPSADDLATQAAERAIDLALKERYDEARQVIGEAIEAYGRQPALLTELAWIEKFTGDIEGAYALYREALATEPGDTDAIDGYASLLMEQGHFRQALEYLTGLPAEVRDHPATRFRLNDLYTQFGWHAHAAEASGKRDRSWWRTGGPIPIVRRRARAGEEQARKGWYRRSRNLQVLEFTAARARTDSYIRDRGRLRDRWARVTRWVRYGLLYAVVVPLWAILWPVVRALWPATGDGRTALIVTVATLVGWAGLRLMVALDSRITTNWQSWSAVFLHYWTAWTVIAIVGGGAVAGGLAALDTGRAEPHWSDAAGLALIAAPGLVVVGNLLLYGISLVSGARLSAFDGEYPRELMLDRLADILAETTDTRNRDELFRRSGWNWRLETVARTLEHDLAKSLFTGDPATHEWMTERAAGAAEAIRRLKRCVVLAQWDRLDARVREAAAAIASGDLSALRWVAPPSPEVRRRRRWRAVLDGVRTVVVMAVPLATVFVLTPVLGLSGDAGGWAKAVGVAWAVLYLLMSLDPTLRDKVETMKNMAETVKATDPLKPGR